MNRKKTFFRLVAKCGARDHEKGELNRLSGGRLRRRRRLREGDTMEKRTEEKEASTFLNPSVCRLSAARISTSAPRAYSSK